MNYTHRDLVAVIVMYNQFCGDSPTCRRMEEHAPEHLKVVIYDNSTSDYGNREYCRNKGWSYLGGEGNLGISKAYNTTIAFLADAGFRGSICLFDDDTHVDEDYFRQMQAADWQAHGIYVPFIYSQGKLLSPNVQGKNHRSCLFSSEREAIEYNGPYLTAINSGMAIDMAIFDDYRYDEQIFLDGIDHQFVRDMRQRGVSIGFINYRCNHEFSGTSKPSLENAIFRFRIFAKDYRYILRESPHIYRKLVGRRALHLTVQYRTYKFLREMFLAEKTVDNVQHCG